MIGYEGGGGKIFQNFRYSLKSILGMISGEGKHYLVKGSGYDQVQKMDQWSNSNQAGVWLFKIGPLDSVEEPKISSNVLDPYSAETCEAGGEMTCHSSATCENIQDGFCCKCIEGWYGDGQSCLPKGATTLRTQPHLPPSCILGVDRAEPKYSVKNSGSSRAKPESLMKIFG